MNRDRVYLGLGTNSGNKQDNLQRAIEALSLALGLPVACSSFMESEPWGFESKNSFLNCVVAFDPPPVAHRTAQHHRGDRTPPGTHKKEHWRAIQRPHHRHRHTLLWQQGDKKRAPHRAPNPAAPAQFCTATPARDSTAAHTSGYGAHHKRAACPATRMKQREHYIKPF